MLGECVGNYLFLSFMVLHVYTTIRLTARDRRIEVGEDGDYIPIATLSPPE